MKGLLGGLAHMHDRGKRFIFKFYIYVYYIYIFYFILGIMHRDIKPENILFRK